jgi:phospholipase/carboxylesterase
VIWLHGLGDTGHGWADVGPQLASVVPHARFIFPTAPTRPVTLNGGMAMTAWFDLTSLSDINSEEDGAGIEASVAYVETLVEAEVAAGVDRSRIVVAGFSQGGAIALTAGLRAPSPFAGVVALSTWLPMAKSYPAALGAGGVATPVIMCHGTQDMVVRTEYGTRSAEALKTLGVTADWHTFRMAHSAVPEELSLVADWLKKRLAA